MVEIYIKGKPVPMSRPRVTIHGTYTPARCRAYKELVALYARQAMRGKEPLDGSLVCQIDLSFAIPKSYTSGKRLACEYNIVKPTGRNTGDADNLAKGIMDALKGIAWIDDSQVTHLIVKKRYGKEDCARVLILDDTEDDTK